MYFLLIYLFIHLRVRLCKKHDLNKTPLCTWCSLKLPVYFLVSQRASQSSIHPSVHTSREADSLCPTAQDKVSLQETVVGFVPISCLTFPRPAPVPLHACSVGKQSGQPAREPALIQTTSQPSIHSFIHGTANFLYPPGPEQGLSLGDSSQLCSRRHALNSPDLPWVPPQGTGHWEGRRLLYAPISLSLFDIIFWPPHTHTPQTPPPPTHRLFFFGRLLSAPISFYRCPFWLFLSFFAWSLNWQLTTSSLLSTSILSLLLPHTLCLSSFHEIVFSFLFNLLDWSGIKRVYVHQMYTYVLCLHNYTFLSLTLFQCFLFLKFATWDQLFKPRHDASRPPELVQDRQRTPPHFLFNCSLNTKRNNLIQRQWLSVPTAHFYSPRRRVGA